MNQATLRIILRWLHIILGGVLACYIYSPWHQYEAFQAVVKFVAVPVIIFSGIWLWKFNVFSKFFRIK